MNHATRFKNYLRVTMPEDVGSEESRDEGSQVFEDGVELYKQQILLYTKIKSIDPAKFLFDDEDLTGGVVIIFADKSLLGSYYAEARRELLFQTLDFTELPEEDADSTFKALFASIGLANLSSEELAPLIKAARNEVKH